MDVLPELLDVERVDVLDFLMVSLVLCLFFFLVLFYLFYLNLLTIDDSALVSFVVVDVCFFFASSFVGRR